MCSLACAKLVLAPATHDVPTQRKNGPPNPEDFMKMCLLAGLPRAILLPRTHGPIAKSRGSEISLFCVVISMMPPPKKTRQNLSSSLCSSGSPSGGWSVVFTRTTTTATWSGGSWFPHWQQPLAFKTVWEDPAPTLLLRGRILVTEGPYQSIAHYPPNLSVCICFV